MLEKKWNENWKYWVDKDSFALVWNIPEGARTITLPHDAMIENTAHKGSLNKGNTGFRDGAVYQYVKSLYAPEEYQNQVVMLKFEGVYMNAFVYVNGQLAGKNPNGYTTFYVPLNDYLNYGWENEIRVQVRNGAMPNSRWYSGGGIYRDVYLLVSELTHIVPEGVQIKTESADMEYGVLKINTEIQNCNHRVSELTLETEIRDSRGNVVAGEKSHVAIFAGEERTIVQRIVIVRPNIWSEWEPILYVCKSVLKESGNILDEQSETFGIRTLQLDAKRGLRVNGAVVKLRGACIHHDSGLLGAATYESVQLRQIRKLKEAGFNAVRMAHHPMAPAMLRACDALGMYVMDEAFDMWNRCKSDYDYGLYFQEWWEHDVTAMVRKDYNHPSVILYSIGNEIPEVGTNHGARVCYDLASKVKALDDTRYTLVSVNGVFAAGDQVESIVRDVAKGLREAGKIEGNVNDFMTLMEAHLDEIVVHEAITERLEKACAGVDIAGYNYMTARYEMDGEAYPNRVIVGSETYPPEIARNWDLAEKLSHVIGDFTWTGWDYIGEAGVGVLAYECGAGGFGAGYPCQLAYVGDIDITGFRRPPSYYREVVFGLRKAPYIAVQNPNRYGNPFIKTPWVISDAVSSWTWGGCEKQPVVVEVYAPGKEVELFVNGQSCGRKPAGKKVGFRTLFETVYEPGEIMAVSYDEAGVETGKMELHTAAEKRKLTVEIEKEIGAEAKTDMQEGFVFMNVLICDEVGNLAADSDEKLRLQVKGAANSWFGSSNPKPEYNSDEGVTRTFNGRAQIILKKNGAEKVCVEITSESGRRTVAYV